MDILWGKRVGGEIVEQGWIVSVPWGIVPGGDLRTAEGGRGRRSVNENSIIIKKVLNAYNRPENVHFW